MINISDLFESTDSALLQPLFFSRETLFTHCNMGNGCGFFFISSVHALQISERMTGISHIPCQSHFIVDVLNKNDPSKRYITIIHTQHINTYKNGFTTGFRH